MKRLVLCAIFILLSISSLEAQQSMQKQLFIGDELPDMELSCLQNGKQIAIHTKDLKGKLVILDFWDIYCSTCIAWMPKMLNYQKQFEEDLQIIYVTYNTQEQVDGQFKKIEKRSNGNKIYAHSALKELPSILKDSLLHRMFPHIANPHTVWIKDGIVKYITFGSEVTSERIKAVIDGQQTDLVNRKTNRSFDHESPLYKEGEGRLLPYLKYYSMLFKEIQEWPSAIIPFKQGVDSLNKVYRFKCGNQTIIDLYKHSSFRIKKSNVFYVDNRVVLEINDSTSYFWPKDISKHSAWKKDNLYAYEMSIALNQKEDAGIIILEDLNRFLPATGRFEKRRVNCLVLVRNENGTRYKYDGKRTVQVREIDGVYEAIGGTMNDLVIGGLRALDGNSKLPVVDGTAYDGKINVVLRSMYKDLNTIRKELQTYGLDLVEKEMEIEMLVIRDKDLPKS